MQHKGVVACFDNQQAHHHHEGSAHKACAMLQGHAGSQHAANDIGYSHGQPQMPPDMPLAGKQNDGGQIGEYIDQLGAAEALRKS